MRPFLASEPAKLAGSLALLGGLLALVAARLEPPAPRGMDEPEQGFSAARAKAELEALVGDGRPHPVGTAEHDRVRERIEARLRALGLEPIEQETVACERGNCASVRNILTRTQPPRDAQAVLLTAHYDSVGAGPGAGDDGSGCAILLEVARVLANKRPARPIILLFSDAEELGLLGARAFVDEHAWAREVGVVINLEARGTSGPTLMFETSGDNGWLARAFSSAIERPVTSSLYPVIYKALPNDTDLSIYRAYGYSGMNFAFIGDAAMYHTALDRVENLDPGSLQQQGDNALAMVRALAAVDLEHRPPGNAVFFDLLSTTTVVMSENIARLIAAVAVLLFLVSSRMTRPSIRGLAVTLGFVVLSFGAGAAISFLMSLRHAPPWVAHPSTLVACAWSIPLALIPIARKPSDALWASIRCCWAVLALVSAAVAPGLGYLFAIPSLASASRSPSLMMGSAAVLLFPIAWLLYDGLGLTGLPVISALVALVLTPSLARAAQLGRIRDRLGIAAGVVVVSLLVVGLARDPHSPQSPVSLTGHRNGAGARVWRLARLWHRSDEALARAHARERVGVNRPVFWYTEARP
jgi:hypothetical protein